MSKLLIIEDDENISGLLLNIFEKSGFMADCAHDGIKGIEMASANEYSLILMDLMLPFKTGEEVIKEIRSLKNVPVIILSAKNTVHDRIELLKLGADDYITKPFDIDEVVLRIQAVLRRTEGQKCGELHYCEITLNSDTKRIFINENEIVCTATEYSILYLMLKNPEKIFSKRNLFESITGEEYLSDDNTMNVHISNLRKKIAEFTDKKYIETVYGMGYRLRNC